MGRSEMGRSEMGRSDSFMGFDPNFLIGHYALFYKSYQELLFIVSHRAAFMTKMMLVGEQAFKFNIWDTAGQERVCTFRSF